MNSGEAIVLICNYWVDSWPVGRGAGSWRTSISNKAWIAADKITQVTFDFEKNDRIGQGYVHQQLNCTVMDQKSEFLKIKCLNVSHGSTVDIGTAINTGQCIKES